jgi:hypothetical protein
MRKSFRLLLATLLAVPLLGLTATSAHADCAGLPGSCCDDSGDVNVDHNCGDPGADDHPCLLWISENHVGGAPQEHLCVA